MDNMYVIRGSSGQYDDYRDWPICVVSSEERAQQIVKDLKELRQFNLQFGERIRNEYLPRHPIEAIQLPARPPPSEDFRNVHSCLLNGKGTPEQKARFAELNREHIGRIAAWNMVCTEIKAKQEESNAAERVKLAEWVVGSYLVPHHLKHVAPYGEYDFVSKYPIMFFGYDLDIRFNYETVPTYKGD